MHLLWAGKPVPASVAALGDLLAQWSGWERLQPLASPLPPDGLLLDWSPRPPEPHPDLPLLWIAHTGVNLWVDDGQMERPRRLRSVKAVRPTDILLGQPVGDDGPRFPMLRGEEPVPLPGAIHLAHAPSGAPLVVGLQARDGRQPAVYIGADLGTLVLQAVGAGRDLALARCGHPVVGLFARTGEPEHVVKFAWVNHVLAAVRWCCDWLAREARIPRVAIGRYPEGKSWALALSHDVDVARRTMVHVAKQVRHAGRRAAAALAGGTPAGAASAIADGLRTGARADFWAIEDCLAADEALGVRSSFYFYSKNCIVNNIISSIYDPDYSLDDTRVASSIAAVIDRGCEVGLHGSYLSHADPALLRAEHQALEQCVGQAVTGVRQHFLQGEAPELWRVQSTAGLLYDTSWSYRDRTGFRSGLAAPYRPWDGEADRSLDLWELPLVLMDGQLYDRECTTDGEVQATLDQVLKQVRLSRGAGAADWHQRFFADPGHPWRLTYERMVARARDAGAWLGPCGALVDWWRSRAALRWTVRRAEGTWHWRVETLEPIAHLTVALDGVRAETVEVVGDTPGGVRPTAAGVELAMREIGPGRPCEFRARPAAA